MLKNYFRTAWRNLWKNKVFSLINVAGLAVGIACFILLALYIWNELGYDRFHEKAGRIVRVKMIYQYGDGEKVDVAVTPTAVVPDFSRKFPEIEAGARVYRRKRTVQYGEKLFNEREFLYADSSFFDIFSFNISQGNPATLLDAPNSVVLTEETAKKYFGSEDPLGKLIRVDNSTDLKVTGIVEDIPSNSQIKFDFMASFSTLELSKKEVWCCANYVSYLLLNHEKSIPSLQQKVDRRTEKMLAQFSEEPGSTRFELEPLTKVHLYSTAEGPEPGGNINYIYILGVVAALQLLIACINFMNLSTARSAERMQEIGVRKTMGAPRHQLFRQFMSESAVITFISLLLGIVIVLAALPLFNYLTDRELRMETLLGPWSLAVLFLLFFVVTFLAGAYPSVFLSAFRPVTMLAGKRLPGRSGGSIFRKGLVIFQFAISVFFIVCTLIVSEQLHYIQNKKLGLERDRVLVIDEGPGDKLEAFKHALLQQSDVENMTASANSPVHIQGGYTIVEAEGKAPDFAMNVTALPVEKDFLKTMGMKLVAGRDFSSWDVQLANPDTDSTRYYHFIVNQAGAKALGWSEIDAIGKGMNLNGRKGEISGVVEDFHFASMHQSIAPLVIFPEYNYFGNMLIKATGGNLDAAIRSVERTWQSFFPVQPFEYHFLNEDFDRLYRSEQQISKILTLFAALTIFITCLGLFGLAAFSAVQRTKEIGIRKVLGASVSGVVALLSKDFVTLVLIAIVIATPIAWYAMNKWLHDFAYRIELQWWMFVLAGLLALAIALLTVSFQSVKAALANPVKSLRSE